MTVADLAVTSGGTTRPSTGLIAEAPDVGTITAEQAPVSRVYAFRGQEC